MKTLIISLVFCIVQSAMGEVSTRICRSDGNTPFEYQDIMVGTKLTIIVSSDVNEFWGTPGNGGGSLAIEEAYWNYGVLSARGPEVGEDWSGSHLPAAGDEAVVWRWEVDANGFDLYTGSTGIQAGDWFIIDYNAIGVGDCNVGFYDHNISWDIPIYNITFSHVRTRDFNNDTKVDFGDFGILASYWQRKDCHIPSWCNGADLDINGSVDCNDLMLFSDYWLETTR